VNTERTRPGCGAGERSGLGRGDEAALLALAPSSGESLVNVLLGTVEVQTKSLLNGGLPAGLPVRRRRLPPAACPLGLISGQAWSVPEPNGPGMPPDSLDTAKTTIATALRAWLGPDCGLSPKTPCGQPRAPPPQLRKQPAGRRCRLPGRACSFPLLPPTNPHPHTPTPAARVHAQTTNQQQKQQHQQHKTMGRSGAFRTGRRCGQHFCNAAPRFPPPYPGGCPAADACPRGGEQGRRRRSQARGAGASTPKSQLGPPGGSRAGEPARARPEARLALDWAKKKAKEE
jgi:hypothetical protein